MCSEDRLSDRRILKIPFLAFKFHAIQKDRQSKTGGIAWNLSKVL